MNEALKHIRAIVTDVDGVLTDGSITYDSHGIESKTFQVKDGQICGILKRHGLFMGIITGRYSEMVDRRAKELGFDFIEQGCKDKASAIRDFAEQYNLDTAHIAYIGDDINDLPAFAAAGVSATPADAPEYVKAQADICLNTAGGKGVFREFGDLILKAQGLSVI